jgi:predicted nucleotidyltransferase component of viral defense system
LGGSALISKDQVKRFASVKDLPRSTIEKDIAQVILLKELSGMNMAFKGGTCLQKVYFKGYRFSEDLDFTLLEDNYDIERSLESAAISASSSTNIDFELVDFRDLEDEYTGNFRFETLSMGGNPLKVRVDITKPESETVSIQPVEKKVHHDYFELISPPVCSYNINEIFAEKVRSLFQRTNPKDLFDVAFLQRKIEIKNVKKLVFLKFRNEEISMDIEDFKRRKIDFSIKWGSSMADKVKRIPEFDSVYWSVLMMLQSLKKYP